MSATTDALANLIARTRSEAIEHREEAANYREQSDEAAKLALEAETVASELEVLLRNADEFLPAALTAEAAS